MRGAAVLALVLVAGAARADERGKLVRPLGEAEVDWRAGVVRAHAGAAADLRLPGPENARPAAERQARQKALGILREALPLLPLGGGRKPEPNAVAAALEHAQSEAQYQSNGGVLLTVTVAFADLARPAPDKKAAKPGKDEEVALAAPSAPLAVAPALQVGQRRLAVRAARYELGPPPAGSKPLAVRADKDGTLVLRREPDAQTLTDARVVIYLDSVAEPRR